MSTSHSCTIPARAALAGNPSDGHGGAVVATVLDSLAATVSAEPADRFGFDGLHDRFASAAEVSMQLDAGGFDGDKPLMSAALAVLHRRFGAEPAPQQFRLSTTIPRSLGLAGSSAIVIATISALVDCDPDTAWADKLTDQPELIASLALEAERDLLGIPAGLQDRVVQTLGGTVVMEFGDEHMRVVDGIEVGSYRSIGPLPHGLFVAYREGTSRDSGSVHRPSGTRDEAFEPAMAKAADAARSAADAIERVDIDALGEAMNTTFDQRALVFSLDPAHVEMVDVARANGAAVNYTGSGGAVIVSAPDDRARTALVGIGCTIASL